MAAVSRPSTATRPGYRPATLVELRDTVEWWNSVALFGGLMVGLALGAAAGSGEVVAIVGFALFLATAVVAGAERFEAATAVGAAAVIWTALGISLVLGTDPSPAGTALGFALVGAAAGIGGVAGRRRVVRREGPARAPGRSGI
jgi:hypothetical protein